MSIVAFLLLGWMGGPAGALDPVAPPTAALVAGAHRPAGLTATATPRPGAIARVAIIEEGDETGGDADRPSPAPARVRLAAPLDDPAPRAPAPADGRRYADRSASLRC